MKIIRESLIKLLEDTVEKLKADTCEVSEEQAVEIIKVITHVPMSKEKAAMYLNMSTSRFDTLVREGYLPKGRKRLGWKEKRWYQDEIDDYIRQARK